jgi:hypothetical protein
MPYWTGQYTKIGLKQCNRPAVRAGLRFAGLAQRLPLEGMSTWLRAER